MRYLVVGLLALIVTAPAMAEPIPSAELVRVNAACVTNKADAYTRLFCWCFASRLGTDISLQKYLTLSSEAKNHETRGLSPVAAIFEVQEFRAIARECRNNALRETGQTP